MQKRLYSSAGSGVWGFGFRLESRSYLGISLAKGQRPPAQRQCFLRSSSTCVLLTVNMSPRKPILNVPDGRLSRTEETSDSRLKENSKEINAKECYKVVKYINVGRAYAGALSLMSSFRAYSGSWLVLGTLFNVKFWVPK